MRRRVTGSRLRVSACALLVIISIITTISSVVVYFQDVMSEEGEVIQMGRLDLQSFDPARLSIVQDAWQDVPGTKEKLVIYSAFYERRDAYRLRVIATSSSLVGEALWCHLWYDEIPSVTVQATSQIINVHHGTNVTACFILCPLSDTFPVPDSVSIVTAPSSIPANRLAVIDNDPEVLDKPMRLAVCVKPLFDFSNFLELVEFVELYNILGVDQVVIYPHSVSAEVQCALDSYSKSNDVTMFPWQLDLLSPVHIRSEAIFASLNDCLYRYMHRYSNVIVVDLDEFVIPHTLDSLQEMVQSLNSEHDADQNIGSYVFKNAFFHLDWPQIPPIKPGNNPWISRLHATGKLRRELRLEDQRFNSPFIFKPERVMELGNHSVTKYLPGARRHKVAPTVGLCHQYRACDKQDGCSHRSSKLDKTALRYKARLLRRVQEKWDEFRKLCHFPNIRMLK